MKVRSVVHVTLLYFFFLFIKKTKQKWSQNQVFSTKKHHYLQMIINMHIPDNTVSVLHSTYSTSTRNSNISWCNTVSSTPCCKVRIDIQKILNELNVWLFNNCTTKITNKNSDEICLYKNVYIPKSFEADTFHRLSNLNKTLKFNITNPKIICWFLCNDYFAASFFTYIYMYTSTCTFR